MSQRLAPQNQNSVPCSWCRAANAADAKNCASCGAPLHKTERASVSFARALPVGTRLRGGDYEIQDVIGQGRFGITYRALNQRLNRLVAVKEWFPTACERASSERDGLQVLAGPDWSAAEFAASKTAFLDEARVLARFDHPALVSVFAAWEENAGAYMEMELLHGPTLAQVLERFHHLKADDALRLFAPVLDALEQLHAQNWLHRDFNPHNIVLGNAQFEATDAANCVRAARAVVIDFGAARQIVPDVVQEFAVAVTPGYSPLEQYAVRARRGAYCDIYALCATLYHALSGQIPPPAPERASGAELIPLRDLAPSVPEALCGAIANGLEIEIARRPQNVRDLCALMPPLPSAAPVVPVQNAPQVLAPPAMPIKPVEKTPQVLAAPLVWPQAANDAKAVNSKARGGSGWWWIAGPLGFALLMGVLRPRPRVEPHWSVPATRLIDEPIREEPLHPPQTEPISRPSLFKEIPPWNTQGKIVHSAFSADGKVAGIDNQGDKATIRIWDTRKGRVLHSLGTLSQQRTAAMAFSPNGKLLAIREVALPSPRLLSDFAADVKRLHQQQAAEDRKLMKQGKYTPEKWEERSEQGRTRHTQRVQELQKSQQEVQEHTKISVFEVESGQRLWTHEMLASQLQWSPDGSELLLHVASPGVTGCYGRTGQPFTRSETMPFLIASADATWFADYNSQTVRVDYRDKSDGWQWKLDADERLNSLRFAPDNSWLMGLGGYGPEWVNVKDGEDLSQNYAATQGGGRAWFFDLQTGKIINVYSGTLAKDEGASFGAFFSPRGRYVGIWRFDNVLRVWEVRTHRDFAFRWPLSLAARWSRASAGKPQNPDGFDWRSSEFSPDENQIVLSGTSRQLWLVDLSARTIRRAFLPLPAPEKSPTPKPSGTKSPDTQSSDAAPVSIKASFTADNQHIVWLNAQTGQMGRLSLDDFAEKVPVEIVDGATSRPE